MKKYHILLVGVLALGITSCSTIRKSTATSAEVQTSVVQYPTVTDLEVMNKAEKTVTWNFTPFKPDNLTLAKSNLMADLLRELNADVLLEPQYVFVKIPFGERKLTIFGFPAKFKDFRKATDADIEALKSVYTVEEGSGRIYNIAQPAKREKRFLGIF